MIGEQLQKRNSQRADLLTSDFLRANEFFLHPLQLEMAMNWPTKHGGGAHMWAFSGQSRACYGDSAGATWAHTNVDSSNYMTTDRGAPFVRLNGTDEYLSIANAAAQESGTEPFFVYGWARPETVGGGTIASKWNVLAAADERSWRVYIDSTSVFAFDANPDGTAGSNVTHYSEYTLEADKWHFFGAYFYPSTMMALGVGKATDVSLTYDQLFSGVPAQLDDGTSDLFIGALTANAGVDDYLDGDISFVSARASTPSTDIRGYMTYLFQMTRKFYEE